MVDTQILHIHFGVGADSQHVLIQEADPIKQRPADTLKRVGGLVDPAANLLGKARAESDFVTSVEPTLVGIGGGLAVNAGSELKFLKRHLDLQIK